MIKTPGRRKREAVSESKDLKVFCRVRPESEGTDTSWLSVVPPNLIVVSNPDPNLRNKESHFSFSQVFPEWTSQKCIFEGVAMPLVENVLLGKNSLLFTYGVTGSGKTYTMKGTSSDGGIMPRCLDIIFNSISDCQAKKHIFKPDRLNGFEMQSEIDALNDQQQILANHIKSVRSKTRIGKCNSDPDLANRCVDPTKIDCVDEHCVYSVFVTYIEIYNNSVFDLLDELMEEPGKSNFKTPTHHSRPRQLKVIREDSLHNMYVHGATEVEVSSTEEAYETFCKGLRRRKVAQTCLNVESSRSHSVFSVRVAQASKRDRGEEQTSITVGQLSLVDLAGSERTNRTNNTGVRLREAGNINNSLMTLRSCLEALRENQNGGNKVVPYRDSRLTTLFKSFFEGDGLVSMIVCINPHPDNYDENLHVLRFAEMSQEVQIACPVRINKVTYTPGKRTHHARRAITKELSEASDSPEDEVPVPRKVLRSKQIPLLIGPNKPKDAEQTKVYMNEVLKIEKPSKVVFMEWSSEFKENASKLDTMFQKIVNNNVLITRENKTNRFMLDREKEKFSVLEKRAGCSEVELNSLKRRIEDNNQTIKRLKTELAEKDELINKKVAEKDRVKEKFIHKTAEYQEKMSREMQTRLRRQKTEMEIELRSREQRINEAKRVLSENNMLAVSSTPSVASTRAKFETPTSSVPATPRSVDYRQTRRGVAVSNRRHRRSRSAGDRWLDHRPAQAVPLGTVMQPALPRRKSVTKLTDAKDLTQGTSKYCLMTQDQDSEGDLETRLYKADVIPTAGGGAQVMFNDVEVLRQESPTSPRRRMDFRDPQPSCSVAIEGHRLRSHRV